METGETVPDFDARLHDGRTVRLSELTEDGAVVLFFYPKAFAAGCTQEACHFRDLDAEFEEAGATPIGVSRDDAETQASFKDEYGLTFPLIADEDGEIAAIFGAKRLGPLWSRRRTYVIGEDRQFLGEISSETDMEMHADEALRILREDVRVN